MGPVAIDVDDRVGDQMGREGKAGGRTFKKIPDGGAPFEPPPRAPIPHGVLGEERRQGVSLVAAVTMQTLARLQGADVFHGSEALDRVRQPAHGVMSGGVRRCQSVRL